MTPPTFFLKAQKIMHTPHKKFRKQLTDVFYQKLFENFEQYCHRHDQEVNLSKFLDYLLDNNIIQDSKVRNYAIKQSFEELYNKNEGKKTMTVNMLADRFNLTPRSVWNVLRDRSK